MSIKIIEFEGIDGSGKTTAFEYFAKVLESKGLKVLRTREVGNPHIPICVELRKLVLNPEIQMDGRAMECVFAAMRIENQKFYNSVASKYDVIVSDRGWLSHLAYTDHNVSKEFTDNFYLNVIAKETRRPDTVIWLDINPEVALARRNKRNGFVDAIEAKGQQFQKLVYNSFLNHIEAETQLGVQVLSVDANQNIDGVQSQLNKLAEEWLSSHKK
jgi:dTMP kinase